MVVSETRTGPLVPSPSIGRWEQRSPPAGSDEPSYKGSGRSSVLGWPVVVDFDLLGQKLQEDTDSVRQESTLSKIDGMQFIDVAWIERLKNRDKPLGGDIILDHERGQPNQADIVDGKHPQRIAIAGLDVPGRRQRGLDAPVNQRPALRSSGIVEAKTIVVHQLSRRLRNAVSREIAR